MRTLLTLIVPLFDRHSLTHRVLTNLDKQKCEFKIIVADGSEDPYPEELLDSYENLRIDYFYSGYDEDITQFIHKLSKAINKVYTPFCMLFDNDDLIDLKGVSNGVAFLAENTDYSSYQNDVRVLDKRPEFTLGDSLYTHDSIEEDDAFDRIKKSIYDFNSFNYAVLRTPIIRCLLDSMSSFNIGDFQFFQKGLACFAALFGKCKRLHNESYYYFIPGDSTIQGTGRIHKFSNWCETMYWPQSAMYLSSFVDTLHKQLYMTSIRESFLSFFTKEVHDKNNIPPITKQEIERMTQISVGFDECVISETSRTIQEIKNTIWYPRQGLNKRKNASHEEFVKWLNM